MAEPRLRLAYTRNGVHARLVTKIVQSKLKGCIYFVILRTLCCQAKFLRLAGHLFNGHAASFDLKAFWSSGAPSESQCMRWDLRRVFHQTGITKNLEVLQVVQMVQEGGHLSLDPWGELFQQLPLWRPCKQSKVWRRPDRLAQR